MYTKNEPIRNLIKQNKVLIAAHRGTYGGNIAQNTYAAYKNAMLQGADMVEVDAAMTVDGVFYSFHNGAEPVALGIEKDIRTMTSAEIDSIHMKNIIGHTTNWKVEKVADILEKLRGKCLINIDRSWFYWKEILALLYKMNMNDQILLKSAPEEKLLKELEENGNGIMYMPIIENITEWETATKYNINIAATELLFTDLNSDFLKNNFIESLREKGIAPWVNAITLDDKTVLSGHLDDNGAIIDSMDNNWGKLIQLGFEIIQTDWPALLKKYILNLQNAKK